MTLTVGGLCEGYAGIFLGLAQVLDVEHAWYSEYEPPTEKHPKPAQAAAKVLAHRFPGVPNHGDLTAVDWSQVEPVDIITTGFPCQDVSSAGRQAGMRDGNRSGLWFHNAEIIDLLRPPLVIIENVRGLLSAESDSDVEPCAWCVGDGSGVCLRALGAVLGDLADLGYDTEWVCLPASAVGAPHQRERVFIVAADAGEPRPQGPVGAKPATSRGRFVEHEPVTEQSTAGCGISVANPEGVGWGEGRPEHAGLVGGPGVAVPSDAPTHTDSDGLERRPEQDREPVGPGLEASLGYDADGRVLDWAGYAPAIHRWERVLGRPAPNPTVLGQRGGRQLNPVFVEFLMGLPEGWVTDVPELTRNQKLKVLGNGCVPQQVAAAVRHLLPLLLDQAEEVAA